MSFLGKNCIFATFRFNTQQVFPESGKRFSLRRYHKYLKFRNATLQCLRVIPELEESLKSYSVQPATPAPSKLITASVKNLFHDLKVSQERDGDSVVPFIMVNVLHSTFPQFATRTEQGIFQQQDANECWTEVLRMLANEVDYKPPSAESPVKIAQFLQGQFAVSLTNLEDPEEPPTSTTEPFMQA